MEEQNKEKVVNLDGDLNDHIEQISADALGLSIEQYRDFQELKTDKEKDAFIKAHSQRVKGTYKD